MADLAADSSSAPPREGIVEVPGAKLAYRRFGAGTGEPIVLLHGARMDGRVWDGAAASLAAEHDVVVPDLRGRGRTTCDPDVPASFGSDTLVLIDHLGLDRIHLVGHSMGGGVALELAWLLAGTAASARLASLSLVAPTPTAGWEPGPGVIQFSQEVAQHAAAAERDAAFDTVLRYLWLGAGRTRDSLDAAAVARARTIFLDNLDPPWPTPLDEPHPAETADYARIKTPTLILSGDCDHAEVRAAASTLAATIPSASLRRLAGCGHDIPNERPGELAALLFAHITAHSGGG